MKVANYKYVLGLLVRLWASLLLSSRFLFNFKRKLSRGPKTSALQSSYGGKLILIY